MRFVVTGRVEPERADVSFGPPQTREMQNGGTVKIFCDSSQLTVIIRDCPQIDNPYGAFIFATDMASAWIDALGFAKGTGWSVHMVQVTTETDESQVYGVRPENLHFDNYVEVFALAEELSGKDVVFRFALHDYVCAITEIRDCAHYCYRAIDAICSSFGTGNNTKKDWDEMHAALGTKREEIISKIKAFADPVRHGNWIGMKTPTLGELDEMRLLTRDILVRYMNRSLSSGNATGAGNTS